MSSNDCIVELSVDPQETPPPTKMGPKTKTSPPTFPDDPCPNVYESASGDDRPTPARLSGRPVGALVGQSSSGICLSASKRLPRLSLTRKHPAEESASHRGSPAFRMTWSGRPSPLRSIMSTVWRTSVSDFEPPPPRLPKPPGIGTPPLIPPLFAEVSETRSELLPTSVPNRVTRRGSAATCGSQPVCKSHQGRPVHLISVLNLFPKLRRTRTLPAPSLRTWSGRPSPLMSMRSFLVTEVP